MRRAGLMGCSSDVVRRSRNSWSGRCGWGLFDELEGKGPRELTLDGSTRPHTATPRHWRI